MQGSGAFRFSTSRHSRVLDYAFPAQWTGSDNSRSVVGYVFLFSVFFLFLMKLLVSRSERGNDGIEIKIGNKRKG